MNNSYDILLSQSSRNKQMTNLQTIANQINSLIVQRDGGANTQAAIDALMVEFEAHPEAIAIREEAAKEAAYDL